MKTQNLVSVFTCLIFIFSVVPDTAAAEGTFPKKTTIQVELEERAKADEKVKSEDSVVGRGKAEQPVEIEGLNLPKDTSSVFSIKELQIRGNTLISTDEILDEMPLVHNASDESADKAAPTDLYDLRAIHNLIANPGELWDVSRRTMQGLTQHILLVYQDKGYAGIYVYISAKAGLDGAELEDGILPIDVVEAKVSEIETITYNSDGQKVEKGFLRSSTLQKWSPIKNGQVAKKKKLDNFVNLLNLNPDRHVYAIISRGSEPNTLALEYNIYEANPWHFYIQVDNSGNNEKQWAPRVGIVNTNLLGRDDRLTATYQAKPDSLQDNFGTFASYDFPLFMQKLRLNLFSGYSEFDISGSEGIDFLGNGSFFGGILRYNLFQKNGWFFDLIGSLTHEHSKSIPSLFPTLGSDLEMNLLGLGFNLHRSNNISDSFFSFEWINNLGGSNQNAFWNSTALSGARSNSSRDFAIYNLFAAHSQYLDPNKIHRLSGSFRWVMPDKRLPPSRMTSFGGLYSVRGYKEDGIVADGGILLSGQYEFDLVKHYRSKEPAQEFPEKEAKNPWLKKLALLAFSDFAQAKIKNAVPGEIANQELWSIGTGIAIAIKDNFDAGIYYGYPLTSTDSTSTGSGRWNFSFIWRF